MVLNRKNKNTLKKKIIITTQAWQVSMLQLVENSQNSTLVARRYKKGEQILCETNEIPKLSFNELLRRNN